MNYYYLNLDIFLPSTLLKIIIRLLLLKNWLFKLLFNIFEIYFK